jgi:hypothetical protein
MMPTDRLLPRDVDLLGTSAEGFGRTSARMLALPGGDGARDEADLALLLDTEVALVGELEEDHGNCEKVGEVFRRGNVGFAGAGRGLRNLSVGFIVRYSEHIELTLSFRDRPLLLRAKGTFRTLISWPGSIGQVVVDGSAELWNSISSSSVYCEETVS